MAVVSCNEEYQRPFTITPEGVTADRSWNIETNSSTDDFSVVGVASCLPELGDAHPNDADLFCASISGEPFKQLDAGALWRVTAQYGPVTNGVTPGSSIIYPSKQAMFTGSGAFEDISIDFDSAGDPIVNKAGDPVRPRLIRKGISKTIEIEVNLATASAPAFASYEGKVNNATFKGGAAGTVLCGPICQSGPFYEQTVEYYTFRLVFLYAAETWNVRHGKILNEGFRQKLVDDSLEVIKDSDGNDIQEPRLLDNDGAVLADGGTPIWLEFEPYAEVDMSPLNY